MTRGGRVRIPPRILLVLSVVSITKCGARARVLSPHDDERDDALDVNGDEYGDGDRRGGRGLLADDRPKPKGHWGQPKHHHLSLIHI